MVQEFKRLRVQPLFRRPIVLGKWPGTMPPPKDILGRDFAPIWDWNERKGIVPPRQFPSTTFRPSPLSFKRFGDFDPEYLPTKMGRQAYYNGIRKQCPLSVIVDDDTCSEVVKLLDFWFGHVHVGSRVLSWYEALAELDITKSPGWALYFSCRTKEEVVKRWLPFVVASAFDYFIPQKEHVTPVFTATLKDEMTAKKKVLDEVTRLFKNGPFPFLLFGTMLFRDSIIKAMEKLLSHPDTLGIDLPGPGFTMLLTMMQQSYNDLVDRGCLPLNDDGTVNLDFRRKFRGTVDDKVAKLDVRPELKKFVEQLFVAMMDGDASAWDASFSLSYAACVREHYKTYLPEKVSLLELGAPECFNGVSIWSNELEYFRGDRELEVPVADALDVYFDYSYCGMCAFGGNLCEVVGQESGLPTTTPHNSMGTVVTPYAPLKFGGYLGSAPMETYIEGLKFRNGDDSIDIIVTTKPISLQEFCDLMQRWCYYWSSQSGFTTDAFDLMFLSHKIVWVYFEQFQLLAPIAKPRLEKLLAALKFSKSRDDAINVVRFYAICNGLVAYPETRAKALELVDDWVSKHPRNRSPDQEWTNALNARLSTRTLVAIHSGFDL